MAFNDTDPQWKKKLCLTFLSSHSITMFLNCFSLVCLLLNACYLSYWIIHLIKKNSNKSGSFENLKSGSQCSDTQKNFIMKIWHLAIFHRFGSYKFVKSGSQCSDVQKIGSQFQISTRKSGSSIFHKFVSFKI